MSFDFPCNTFSRARKNDGRGPGPLRSDDPEGLHGLAKLSSRDKARVEEANILLAHTISLIRTAHSKGVVVLLENPKSSRLWLMPEMMKLLGETQHEKVHVDYCQYGDATWRKPTTFITWNLPGLTLCKCDNHKQTGLCSRTGKPHTSLVGKKNGKFLTKLAEPYPYDMCIQIADHVAKRVTSTNTLGRAIASHADAHAYVDIQGSPTGTPL